MNSQSLSPEHTQQGHITSANRVSNWGSNVQTPESVGGHYESNHHREREGMKLYSPTILISF